MDEAHRPFQAFVHSIGASKDSDEKLFEEPDELFWLGMGKSQDSKFLFIESGSKETSEVNYVSLGESSSKLQCVAKREYKVLYDVEHREGVWYISTNKGGLLNMAVSEKKKKTGRTKYRNGVSPS